MWEIKLNAGIKERAEGVSLSLLNRLHKTVKERRINIIKITRRGGGYIIEGCLKIQGSLSHFIQFTALNVCRRLERDRITGY